MVIELPLDIADLILYGWLLALRRNSGSYMEPGRIIQQAVRCLFFVSMVFLAVSFIAVYVRQRGDGDHHAEAANGCEHLHRQPPDACTVLASTARGGSVPEVGQPTESTREPAGLGARHLSPPMLGPAGLDERVAWSASD